MIVWQFFFWSGVAFCALAVYLGWRTKRFMDRASLVSGTVIGLVEVASRNGDMLFAPMVRFRARGADEVEFTDGLASRPARHAVGQDVVVAYDPDDPGTARIGKSGYFGPLVVLVIGAGFATLGHFGAANDPSRREVIAAPAGASVQGFVGRWANENARTPGITSIVITPAGKRALDVKMWGKCQPQDCDWGAPQRFDLKRAGTGVVELTWNPGFAIKTQSVRALPDGRLEVVTRTQFTDRSNRKDYTSTEVFARQ